jgi:hypothetical protein
MYAFSKKKKKLVLCPFLIRLLLRLVGPTITGEGMFLPFMASRAIAPKKSNQPWVKHMKSEIQVRSNDRSRTAAEARSSASRRGAVTVTCRAYEVRLKDRIAFTSGSEVGGSCPF